MQIRHATEEDFPRMMEIYAYARQFMADHGNPNQWGPTNWPPEALIHQDIAQGCSYVCEEDGRVIGVLDIDSPLKDRFTEEDLEGLSEAVRILEAACEFDFRDVSSSSER